MRKHKPLIKLCAPAPERLLRICLLKSPIPHRKLVLFVLDTRLAYGKMSVSTRAMIALL